MKISEPPGSALSENQHYENGWLFGAICPALGKAADLVLPFTGTASMQLHLAEISRCVTREAHGAILLDRAGWHMTSKLRLPRNISLIFLPSRAPELNPVENIWQFLRANWLSNRKLPDVPVQFNGIADEGALTVEVIAGVECQGSDHAFHFRKRCSGHGKRT